MDANLPDVIEKVRPAVLQIGFSAMPKVQEAGNRPWHEVAVRATLGTGFFLNEEALVATALHVVEDAKRLDRETDSTDKRLVVRLAHKNTENMRSNFTELIADVVAEDARHDLALLRLRANPFRGEVGSGIDIGGAPVSLPTGIATLQPQRPRDGEQIAVSGYPLSQSVLITNVGYIASGWPFDIAMVPEGDQRFNVPNIADSYLADAQANPGNSGGPVYSTTDGSVLGVCVAGHGSPAWWSDTGQPVVIDGRSVLFAARLSVIVPSKYVIALATQVGGHCEVF